MHQEKKEIKNSFLNKIWIIWISSYIIWIDKHISNFSRVDQSCAIWSSEQVCHCISKQHTNIFRNRKKTWKTCQKNSKKFSRKKSLSQIRKIQISQTTSQIFGIHCYDWRIENKFRKNKSSIEILYIKMH